VSLVNKIPNVVGIRGSIDDVGNLVSGKFDLIISSYAIYYSRDMINLVKTLISMLTKDGILFLCGPASGTNKEMSELAETDISINDFFPEFKEGLFKKTSLNNKIYFYSADSVMTWWKNHSSFIKEKEKVVEDKLISHFKKNNVFELTKNVLGISYGL